jgi:hypothetical protein
MKHVYLGSIALVVSAFAAGCGGDSGGDASTGAGGSSAAGAGGSSAGSGGTGASGKGGSSAGSGGTTAGSGGTTGGSGGTTGGSGGTTGGSGGTTGGSGGTTGGSGGTTGGSGGSSSALDPKCGTAPYAHWDKTASQDLLFNSSTPDTTIYASLCNGPLVVTDANGSAGPVDVQAGAPFWFLGTSAGHHPSATVEMIWPLGSSSSALKLDMFPIMKSPVSDWYAGSTAAEATIYLNLSAAPSSACTVDGWTLAVENHPEAKVRYFGKGSPDPMLTSTIDGSGKGLTSAILYGITPGEPAKIIGTKAGCAPLLPPSPGGGIMIGTGRHPLIADTHVVSSLVTQ